MARLIEALKSWGHLRIAPPHLLIFAFPICVLIAAEFLLSNYGDPGLDLMNVELTQSDAIAELTGRYRYMAAVFFYLAVSLCLILVFLFELISQHRVVSILLTLLAAVCAIAVALVFSMIEPVWMGSFESYQLLGEAIYRKGLGIGKVAGCGPAAFDAGECLKPGAFHAMVTLNGAVNLVSALASTAVIAGMILALSRENPADLSNKEGLLREAHALEASQAAAKRYLYASGVLLTVGMTMGLAWMNWPSALIADEATRTAHRGLVDALALFRGVSYSVLILSYYIPVSLFLMVRTNRFKAAAAAHGSGFEEEEAEKWVNKIGGFDINKIASLDALKAILAIVSPILTSALGSFGNLAGFG